MSNESSLAWASPQLRDLSFSLHNLVELGIRHRYQVWHQATMEALARNQDAVFPYLSGELAGETCRQLGLPPLSPETQQSWTDLSGSMYEVGHHLEKAGQCSAFVVEAADMPTVVAAASGLMAELDQVKQQLATISTTLVSLSTGIVTTLIQEDSGHDAQQVLQAFAADVSGASDHFSSVVEDVLNSVVEASSLTHQLLADDSFGASVKTARIEIQQSAGRGFRVLDDVTWAQAEAWLQQIGLSVDQANAALSPVAGNARVQIAKNVFATQQDGYRHVIIQIDDEVSKAVWKHGSKFHYIRIGTDADGTVLLDPEGGRAPYPEYVRNAVVACSGGEGVLKKTWRKTSKGLKNDKLTISRSEDRELVQRYIFNTFESGRTVVSRASSAEDERSAGGRDRVAQQSSASRGTSKDAPVSRAAAASDDGRRVKGKEKVVEPETSSRAPNRPASQQAPEVDTLLKLIESGDLYQIWLAHGQRETREWKLFRGWAYRDRTNESVDFLDAVSRYKKEPTKALAKAVYLTFLSEDAPSPINITSALRARCVAPIDAELNDPNIDGLDASLFDALVQGFIKSLQTDVLKQFREWLRSGAELTFADSEMSLRQVSAEGMTHAAGDATHRGESSRSRAAGTPSFVPGAVTLRIMSSFVAPKPRVVNLGMRVWPKIIDLLQKEGLTANALADAFSKLLDDRLFDEKRGIDLGEEGEFNIKLFKKDEAPTEWKADSAEYWPSGVVTVLVSAVDLDNQKVWKGAKEIDYLNANGLLLMKPAGGDSPHGGFFDSLYQMAKPSSGTLSKRRLAGKSVRVSNARDLDDVQNYVSSVIGSGWQIRT